MSDSIQRIKLCEDVANHITERIRTQVWTVGRKLPPETELAELFDVSRATIRSAVKSLQLSGILYSRSGSGTYVSESAPLVLETRELADVIADPQNLYALVGSLSDQLDTGLGVVVAVSDLDLRCGGCHLNKSIPHG